ncbi:dihydroxyacetone kinase subunit DhaL [Miniphocaeibacter massiliensis]|uniref:dihydroxyacetone kinase subunit DhaL n=1 Tax=Miniphocaeibacter massiliensis TaxID=2041841 RepID=UPI000C1B9E93|nr:dihydroxyacetone kinase subunit DhaL [Miniphocaeibacter massiliensis]
MDIDNVKNILIKINEQLQLNKEYLSELDAAIGDGDHGHNMAKGFGKVAEDLKENEYTDIGSMFKKVAMLLISNVGGASGPLYGTAFMELGKEYTGLNELKIEDLEKILELSIKGIKFRGKAELEDKTIIDSLEPAYNSVKESLKNNEPKEEVLNKMVDFSKEGVEHTKEIIARKGRASYLGERSIGHQDPGVTSTYIILKTIRDNILGEK